MCVVSDDAGQLATVLSCRNLAFVVVSPTATCIVISHGHCTFWPTSMISSVGDAKLKKEFIDALSKELLVKITGELKPNIEHSFLGRKLGHWRLY